MHNSSRVPVTSSKRVPGPTPYYGANGIQDYVEGYTHSGEFILVAEDGANDLTNYPVKYINGEAWINNHAHVISNKQGITNTKFLIYRFRMFNYIPFLVGGSRAKLNASSLLKLKMKIPVIEEQEKISHLLYRLENMITLHKRKFEKLKQLQKSYLSESILSEPKCIPKRRFKGFIDEWGQEKLSNVANIVGGGTPSTKESSYWNGDINWFTPNEIGDSKYVKDSLRRITEKGLNNSSAQLLPANKTILFTSRATIGTIGILEEEASTNQGFQSLIVNDFNDVNFLYYKLLTMKRLFLKNSVGSTFLEISGKTMKKIDINIPSKIEQEKIGKLLSKIDKAISLHNLKKRKIEKLKLDLVRRLDFSLTEESDEVVLGDLIEIKSGYGFKSEEFSNNGIPLVRISDIDSGIVKKPDIFIKEDSKHIDFLIKSGDYLIAMSGATTGKVGRYTLSHDAYCNQRIGIIRGIENKIDNNYLEYVLHSSKFQHYISTQWGAGAQPNINLKQIKDYKLRLPKLSEQKLIGSIFANLNSQKDIHKVKVDQLLFLKELYLNKLFI